MQIIEELYREQYENDRTNDESSNKICEPKKKGGGGNTRMSAFIQTS